MVSLVCSLLYPLHHHHNSPPAPSPHSQARTSFACCCWVPEAELLRETLAGTTSAWDSVNTCPSLHVMRRSLTSLWRLLDPSPNLTAGYTLIKKTFLSLISVSNLCCRISPLPIFNDVELLNTSSGRSSSKSQSHSQFSAALSPPTHAVGASEGQGGNWQASLLIAWNSHREHTSRAGGPRRRPWTCTVWRHCPLLPGRDWPALCSWCPIT